MGPVTLVRTSKSRVEHDEDCQYFVPGGQDEGVGLKLQVGTRSRRWNIMAALNYNNAVGAFSINPTLVFKAIVPNSHPSFGVIGEIARGETSIEAGLRSIRLLFQNGEAAPNDVDEDGVNVLTVSPPQFYHYISVLHIAHKISMLSERSIPARGSLFPAMRPFKNVSDSSSWHSWLWVST